MIECTNKNSQSIFSSCSKPIAVGVVASTVAIAAAAVFKTMPLWMPFLIAMGPVGWGLLAVANGVLLGSAITMGICYLSKKKIAQLPNLKDSLAKLNGWDFNYKQFCENNRKKTGRQENSPQEQAELDQERLTITGDRFEIANSLNPEEKDNYYTSKTQRFETVIRAQVQPFMPTASCFVRQLSDQFSKYSVDEKSRETTLETKLQVDHFDSSGKNRRVLHQLVVKAKFNWSDGTITIEDIRPISLIEKFGMYLLS